MSREIKVRFKPRRWNGRRRTKPVEPFCTLHCTASARAAGIKRIAAYFGRLDGRYAAYHGLTEDDGDWAILMDPKIWKAYHSRRGGNDGVGLSMCYSAKDWNNRSKGADGMWAVTIMCGLADMVLDIEERMGVRFERSHRGSTYDADRKAGVRRGFYGHCDIDPKRRSDPLWTRADWQFFLHTILPARERLRK